MASTAASTSPEKALAVLENVVPSTPTDEEKCIEREMVAGVAGAEQGCKSPPTEVTASMKRKSWVQFAALCFAIYVAGWGDGTLGPLLPRLQEVYHVRVFYLYIPSIPQYP